MGDFLKKNKEWQNDKPRPSRQVYRDHIYKGGTGYDRRGERDRRSAHHRKHHHQENLTSILGDFLPEVKSILEKILESQKAQAKIYERMTAAEEGVNESLNKIASAICAIANIQPNIENKVLPVETAAPSFATTETYEEEITADEENTENTENEDISIPSKEKVIKIIVEMRDEGATFDMIAMHLDNENIPTFSNRGKWHAQTIHRLYSQNKNAIDREG